METRHRFSLGSQVGAKLAEARMRDHVRASEIRRAYLLRNAARWDSVKKAMDRVLQHRIQIATPEIAGTSPAP